MALEKPSPNESPFTRRTLLAGAATAFVPVSAILPTAQAAPPARALTAEQRKLTEMLVDRILPADELGPGALELGAANYIDVQMAGYLAPQKEAFLAGLAALDAYAKETRGASFANMSADQRDAVLTAITQEGAPQNLRAFFNQARTYTIQGTFGDPHYGGNLGGKGWDIIRYPGPRLATTQEMQKMDRPAQPYRRSAWGNE
ncbi:MAG TPA: gluconate 2-dehydrogenase subunit 3 family protein [Bryobacteraceae bacterium]|jgi:gluconate 2-dehydrogenase gamma chain